MNHSDKIIELVFSALRQLRRQLACAAHESHDANWLQIHSLALISAREGITMKELAHEMQVAPPSATSFINRMVKLKWVERMMDPNNRKLVRLKVTPFGREMVTQKMDEKKKYMRDILSLLSEQDQIDLERICTHLLDSHTRSNHQS